MIKTKYRNKLPTATVDMLLRGSLNSASLDMDLAVSVFISKK